MTDERDKVLADLEALQRKGASAKAGLDALTGRRKHDNAANTKPATPAPVPPPRSATGKRRRQAGELLDEHDVATRLSVSVQTIRRWRMLRRGPKFVKVGFHVRYKPEDVAAWLNQQPTGGDQPKKGK